MRIDRIEVTNFKKFSEQAFTFDPHFTLLIGENGSGKTSVLDALAVALGIWLNDVPDSSLANSYRRIYASEKRLEWVRLGDRPQFQEAKGSVSIRAIGQIEDRNNIAWEQSIAAGAKRASNVGAKDALNVVRNAIDRAQSAEKILLPVIAYYGAGRAWLSHRERTQRRPASKIASRWAAFYDCLNERIRIVDLIRWFQDETTEAGNRQGRFRPGFEVVRRAILRCVPGADGVWFDSAKEDIVLSINGNPQPFGNLSAGQRMMLALVADIAVKTVTQNNYLVPPDLLPDEPVLPRVLAESPGVVLIDEIDVHLHPRWQRRVVNDLKSTFPSIQFICTSHSPQVIGEVSPAEIRLLDENGVQTPAQSYGMDSNWILRVLMGAEDKAEDVSKSVDSIFELIAQRKLLEADAKVTELRQEVGNSESIQRAAATLERMRLLGR